MTMIGSGCKFTNYEMNTKYENTKIKNRTNFKGSALAYGLVIMAIVLILLTSILTYVSSQIRFSFNRVEREKAFQIAEAGVGYYRWYLAHATDGMNTAQLKAFWGDSDTLGVSGSYEENYKDSETGEIIGKYVIELEVPDSGSTISYVTSTGSTIKTPDLARKVRVRFRRPSWSEYMWVIDDFVAFGDDAEVYGKVHSNFGIRFDGVAHNVVSALPARFNDSSHGGSSLDFGVHTHSGTDDPFAPAYPWAEGTVPERSDVFEAGRQFPVPEVSFSGVLTDLGNMKNEAQAPGGATINSCTTTGCYFNYDTDDDEGKRIILKNNGEFDICTVASRHPSAFHPTSYRRNTGTNTCSSCGGNNCTRTFTIPDDGLIFVEGNVWVDGTVDGKKITIAAANLLGGDPADIFIGLGNIRYTDYNCENIIGLVAQRNITVIRDCPDDFVIDAALIAQSGKISRGNYSLNKSTLTFNGALASYLQPYFNTGNNGFGVRKYNFDNNLLYCPPPYFPTGTEYSIDLWEEL